MQKNVIDNLAKIIAKLPGMGPRIGKKIVLELASNKEKFLIPLIEYLNELYDNGILDSLYNISQSITQSLRSTTGHF